MNRFLLAAIALGVTACAGPSQINDDKVFFEFDSAVISDDARDELESQTLTLFSKGTVTNAVQPNII